MARKSGFCDILAVVMIKKGSKAVRLIAVLMLAGSVWGDSAARPERAPTHADAAVILAKYMGYFDRYVDPEADVTECVRFLNQTGIYFGVMEVLSGSEFTQDDCARAMGQAVLVLSGEARFVHSKVKLPKGIESWKEFCTMAGVDYVEGYRMMQKLVNPGDARKI